MKQVSWNQLQQAEIAELVISTLEIVEKHDPQVIGVKPFYDLLKALEPQLSVLTEPRIAHPLTPTIDDDRKRAKNLCLAIGLQIRAVHRAKVASTEASLYLIAPLAKKYLNKSYVSNSETFNDSLRNFLESVNANETISNAAKAMGIDVYIAELESVKSRLDQNSSIRGQYNVDRRTIKEKQIKKAVKKSMSDLLKAIDLAKVTNRLFDFTLLNTEFDVLYTKYSSKLRGRTTRKLNTYLKKESAALTSTSIAAEPLTDWLV